MGFGHFHMCPKTTATLGPAKVKLYHAQHPWICYRPDCDAPDIYECGLVADILAPFRTKAQRDKMSRAGGNRQ